MKTALMIALLLSQQSRTITGLVHNQDGQPVRGANVFLVESLDGAISDSTGRFTFSTNAPLGAWALVQRVGYSETRFQLSAVDTIRIVLGLDAIALPTLNVQAGRFQTGNAPDAELNTLQVVSTPGASADVYRALQTFPGLQPVNEGAGLFVRGGEIAETRVFINDAIVLSPYRYESPTGGFFGAFDPFLLDGIQFSSGGFGARYGDAMSGVAALRTLGKPVRAGLGASVSLAALSASGDLPLTDQLGLRATFTRSNTHLLFKVNGSTTEFTQEPEGRDASIIANWKYGRGELRWFGLDQWSELGVFLEEPAFAGALESNAHHDAHVVSWEHNTTFVRLSATGGLAGSENDVSFGAFNLTIRDRLRQLRAQAQFTVTPLLGLTLGGEAVKRISSFEGRTPAQSFDNGPDAPTQVIGAELDDARYALFVESDWTPLDRLRAIVGLRGDRSRLTAETTLDPRASLAIRVTDNATFTAAWGIYHQVPAPSLHDPDFGGANLGSMRAEHRIIGLQIGEGAAQFRLEAYQKNYRDLAAFTREREVVDGGIGRTRGLDVFVRWPGLLGINGRTSYSYIRARRTDPNTGILALSPYDVTHVATTVIDRSFATVWGVSLAHRFATGRPFTPIVSATFDAQTGVWEPVYGAPNAERLPSFQRLDLSLSRLVPLPRQRLLVLFAAANNLFDRKNIHDYRYNATYSKRTPVRSQFKRSIYFGASIDL